MAIGVNVARHLKEIVRTASSERRATTTLADEGAAGSLGPYDVQTVLGVGGMGTVYRAIDRATGRPVALKVPHMGAFPFSSRFAREAWLAESLGQVGDTPYLEHGVTSVGTPFLAMPLLDGSSLARRLKATGALSAAETVRIGERVAHVLARLHARGQVHRDVKPDNVMVDERDNVWLMDLGLTGSPATVPPGVGTPAYAAPEQNAGERVGPPADVFALAAMLVEAATGDPLRSAAHPVESGTRLQTSLRRVEPVELRDLLRLMLATDPALRPPDGAAVARALGRIRNIGRLAEASQSWRDRGVIGEVPFVGRERELDLLAAELARHRDVELVGAAGSGRSRLLYRWWCRYGSEHALLLWPDRAALDHARLAPWNHVPLAHAWLACAAGMRGHEPTWQRDLAVEELVARVAPPSTIDAFVEASTPEQQRMAAAAVLQSLAAEHPLMLVCPDRALADRASLGLATELTSRVAARLVVMARERGSLADVTVPPLAPESLVTLARAVQPEGSIDLALAGAHGNPLRLQLALIRAAADADASIRGWLDRFDPYARWIARLASLAGPCFGGEQILELAGHSDGPAVRDALERLADGGMLIDLTRLTGAPAGCYRFGHHLVSDTIRSTWRSSDVALAARRLGALSARRPDC